MKLTFSTVGISVGVQRSSRSPRPSCPCRLPPTEYTRPSSVEKSMWSRPAEMATTVVFQSGPKPGTSVGVHRSTVSFSPSCPWSLWPNVYTEPLLSTTEKSMPAEASVASVRPGTVVAVSRTSVSPTPSRPFSLWPMDSTRLSYMAPSQWLAPADTRGLTSVGLSLPLESDMRPVQMSPRLIVWPSASIVQKWPLLCRDTVTFSTPGTSVGVQCVCVADVVTPSTL
mmetsp:Transcript_3541/g.12877  ORF Transcript_3541/g.12877 Transcript_3541/m.12877 type:complete len:226 (-) Transcript_3541:608-1285(-)